MTPRNFSYGRQRRGTRHAAQTIAALLLVASAAAAGTRAADLPAEHRHEILSAALNAFDQATAVARSNPAESRELYRSAAGSFQALCDGGVCNAGLEYNLGNAFYRTGDAGRAILHYRRAARLDPTSTKLQANLRYVRQQVEPRFEPPARGAALRTLLFWHFDTTPRLRLWLSGLCSAAGAALLLTWLRWHSAALRNTGAALVVVSLALGGSLLWELHDDSSTPAAVVVQDHPVLRLGRGESSDPALRQPLGPGVELRILQQRGDWVEVRLADEKTSGWLPASTIERV